MLWEHWHEKRRIAAILPDTFSLTQLTYPFFQSNRPLTMRAISKQNDHPLRYLTFSNFNVFLELF